MSVFGRKTYDEQEWISLADLMSGLMLFESGSAELQEAFKERLNSFFPIWLATFTTDERHRDFVREVSVEGHTSSEWEDLEGMPAYLQNMALSQARALSVLNYVIALPISRENWDPWLRERITASGLSSSKIKFTNGGFEDRRQSRRVEFRVITNAEERLRALFDDDGELFIGTRNDTEGPT
jgi:outer membrane protein OmpA-like peptidoglycan-associated protein